MLQALTRSSCLHPSWDAIQKKTDMSCAGNSRSPVDRISSTIKWTRNTDSLVIFGVLSGIEHDLLKGDIPRIALLEVVCESCQRFGFFVILLADVGHDPFDECLVCEGWHDELSAEEVGGIVDGVDVERVLDQAIGHSHANLSRPVLEDVGLVHLGEVQPDE